MVTWDRSRGLRWVGFRGRGETTIIPRWELSIGFSLVFTGFHSEEVLYEEPRSGILRHIQVVVYLNRGPSSNEFDLSFFLPGGLLKISIF